VTTLFIIFVVFSSSIYLAKRNIRDWKKYTAIFFLRKVATFNPGHNASLWMRKFGYDEEDAWRLAIHQLVTGWGCFFIVMLWFAIASTLQTH